MSPRAACRLERLGFAQVHDYTAGKADWLAAGLRTEGKPHHPARALEAADRDPPVCKPDDLPSEVATRLSAIGRSSCAVVVMNKVVLGRFRIDWAIGPTVEAVMEPGPTTVRADADLAATRDRLRRRKAPSVFVTTPEGALLGELFAS